ncbi:MAG: polysaccharide deacetylase family protein [Epsilonproteobacteria bacterium]|nr:polysaccharide deacetylase [Campylobacterota bacterium]NPA56734.1 polysaccharide deacetylase family protein [Campylobacterota bacterium]
MLRKLLLLGSLSLWLWAEAHIFVYHRFGDPRYPSTNTSLSQLRRDFTYLKEHGYKVIPLVRLVEALRKGEEIDDRWVVITIDDGFRSFLNALPIFKEFGYPFTIFVATRPIEGRYGDFLRWEDLKEISRYGEIALHSHSHPHLCDLPREAIVRDTRRALTLFKERLGFLPRFYAYPYGEYDGRVKEIIGSLGFLGICNQNRGAVGDGSDPLDLDRVALVGKSDLRRALKIGHLEAEWRAPISYPKDGVLKRVQVRVDPRDRPFQLYVTDYGWRRVTLHGNTIDLSPRYLLKRGRVRVIIKGKNSKMSTKILVRSRYGAQ